MFIAQRLRAFMKPLPTNSQPIRALAVDGEVVIFACGPRNLDAAFTPDAILASLESLRLAAEQALTQRGRVEPES